MIFKRFSLHRKEPEICNIYEQEIRKKFLQKKKTLFLNIYTGLGYFILTT